MSLETVKDYLRSFGLSDRIRVLEDSSATVPLAAQALGVEPARIAKTLSFQEEESALLVVMAGDAKVDNKKFKGTFGHKASMLSPEKVEMLLGHTVGGVCPFAIPKPVPVYLDVSLKRFDTVFPACGTSNSAIPLSCDELFTASNAKGWVDVGKTIE